jgi:hypothetical protein
MNVSLVHCFASTLNKSHIENRAEFSGTGWESVGMQARFEVGKERAILLCSKDLSMLCHKPYPPCPLLLS